MKNTRRSSQILIGVFWLFCVLLGGFALNNYAQAPGDGAAAPSVWPASVEIPRALSSSTLLVFLHPDCSCSRATLDELAKILVFAPKTLKTYAVFVRPEGWSDDQLHGDLWARAQAIAGVSAIEDLHGDAKAFGAKTSGHTVLYDFGGRLQFYGGITSARGHNGDNYGEASVVSALRGLASGSVHTNVYGCGIFSSASVNKVSRWASRLASGSN